jgi:hypothetical protein
MRRIVGRDARLVVIAAVTASLTTGLVMAAPAVGGAVAAIVRNSHMVDGRHAVGAGASVKARKGKLVATSPKTGKLPSNIIATAPNARRLGGKGAATYARKAALRSPGTINESTNPVRWSKLNGVPRGLADGTDDIGPRAFAHVSDAGVVEEELSTGMDTDGATHPADGVYCFDLSFEPKHVLVTIDLRRSALAVEAGVQPYATFGPGSITSGGNCGSGSTADALVVFRDGTDTRHNAAFFVSFM